MTNKSILKKVAVVICITAALWFLSPTMPLQKVKTQSVVDNSVVKTQIAPISIHGATQSLEEQSPFKNVATNETAILVAKAYAAALSFPAYSQPLAEDDFDRLNPNYFNPQTIPVDESGNTLTASLTKFRYTYPEPIVATISGKNISNARIELIDLASENKNILAVSDFKLNSNSWQASIEGLTDLPEQLQATVVAEVNENTVTMALSLKYVNAAAIMESIESVKSRDADMVINAQLTTREKGLYRVRANLFDANNSPIAYLSSRQRLEKGTEYIELKAHKSVLNGRQAPFYLSTFVIELMSPAPGTPKRYGTSKVGKYLITDFAVSSLDNAPYELSLQEQQRLELLNKIADDG
ncbi:hypothetical protein HII17_14820 [Thalassotalea sp. M1531]|uniref:Uncharacterized protein n=1 Tax=Thalassotalea algicola TaxID=2716224 RepID=A0A7Y0LEL6_9GAMM|nr:hypothetical protein [Thalassotalea algicola]NMP32827.1 hypothetical protein [Thalassotalea algicola]